MIPLFSSASAVRRAAVGALVASVSLAACAMEPSDAPLTLTPAQAGRELAQRECARCHAIGELGRRQGGAMGEAYSGVGQEPPPLRDVLDRYSANRLKMAFQEGMIVGHAQMPVYRLSDEETDALLAYLQSIGG